MSKIWNKIMVLSLTLLPYTSASSQIFMDATGTGDTYKLIESKGYGVEVPDCVHPVMHISQVWDYDLKKYVFAFNLHVDLDNDRCINFDRQRCEIKTWDHSPSNMIASEGQTYTYRWKFKLDAAFQPSHFFCHIHQIKAVQGSDAGAPLMTFTPRLGNPEKFQLIFTPPKGNKGGGVMKEVALAPFKGEWVEATENVKFSHSGTYQVTIKRVRDGETLFTWSSDNIDMWRDGTKICRPKYGIYRSLKDKAHLRDESVLFSDFWLSKAD